MMRRRHICFALTLLVAALACGERAAPDAGSSAPAQRIVSLIPSATETIVALDAAKRLVARSDYDTDSSLAHLPSLGGGLTPSLEQITVLSPDLVVAWPDNMSRSVTARLVDLGIEVYAPTVQSLGDIYEVTRELGRRLGREPAADSLVASIQTQLASIREVTSRFAPPSVFYVVWHNPPTTAGPGTFIQELIEIAGARNVFADAPSLWPQVSLEEIVQRQPDVLILPEGEGFGVAFEQLQTAVGWRDLSAVRERRIVKVDAELFGRPGPRVAEAARQLAHALHPDMREATTAR